MPFKQNRSKLATIANSPGYSSFPGFLRFPYRALQRLIVLEGTSVMVANAASVSCIPDEHCLASSLTEPNLRRFLANGDGPYCEDLADRMDDENLYCFGVESAGRLLSFAWLYVGEAEPGMNCGYCRATATAIRLQANAAFVFNAYTDPAVRGQRLMTHVLSKAADWLTEHRGIKQLVATTELINDSARMAFANADFVHAASYWRVGIALRATGWYPQPSEPILMYGE